MIVGLFCTAPGRAVNLAQIDAGCLLVVPNDWNGKVTTCEETVVNVAKLHPSSTSAPPRKPSNLGAKIQSG